MDEEICTFSATPCFGTTPQRFRAVYQFTTIENGLIRKALVPGTLEQLTSLSVVEHSEVAPAELVPAALTA